MTSPAVSAPSLGFRALRLAVAIALAWTTVALLLSLQGYLTSVNAGGAQAWWPSLGYSLAIFSVWAVLTAPILAAVRRVEATALRLPARLGVYATGAVAVAALHVGLFVLAYWPIYNDHGRVATRWAMGEAMFVRNLGTNVIFYACVVALGLWTGRRDRRSRSPAPDVLRARSRGSVRIVPLEQVDWIAAAGNYAEAHLGADTVLLDESLASLAGRLPPDRFARIHRRAIVRLDRIEEVRSLGRGDAEVRLSSGQGLRLSRRYRDALSTLLDGR